MSPLERRYRWLLRGYPAGYRTERADEMLGTLLEAQAPGQRWPGARESAGLMAGGIRARAATNASLPLAANVRLAALLASATYVGLVLGLRTERLMMFGSAATTPLVLRPALICAGLFTATVLVWFTPRLVAVLALATVLATASALGMYGLKLILVTLVLAVLIVLRAERPPRSWLWWCCLPLAFLLSEPVSDLALTAVRFLLVAAFLLAPAMWAFIDARPAFALAILMAWLGLAGLGIGHFSVRLVLDKAALAYLAVGVLAALPFLLRTRRRRRAAL